MSKIISGILISLAGPALIQWGFSESCSGEISGIVVPLLAALPGAALAWWARVKMGGHQASTVNVMGVKK